MLEWSCQTHVMLSLDPSNYFAEATCKSQILTARAVVSDVGEAAASRCGINLWSECNPSNSERDVHQVIKKQGTKLDVKVSSMRIKGIDIPWICPRDWFSWLLSKGFWPRLAGLPRGEYRAAGAVWGEFWNRFQKLQPDFELFNMPHIDLTKTAAFMIHGDEGRTLKRHGIMITSIQSALGFGFDSKRFVRPEGGRSLLKVNYTGHSFIHRFITSTIPKTVYEDDPDMFHGAMNALAVSLKSLLIDGVVDTTSNETFRVAIIAVKGDAPYLAKMGCFYRHYSTTVKRGDERTAPKGICHRCLAGTTGFPAEDLSTVTPKWLQTRGIRLPWLNTPAVIEHLVHDVSDPSTYFQFDIWHVVHLGFGRSWIASVVQLLIPFLPAPNLEAKWQYLTREYKIFCRAHKKQSHITSISAYLMSYSDRTGAMGNWHKGSLTTNFMKWLPDLLANLAGQLDERLRLCQQATVWMNELWSTLFKADAFLTNDECELVSRNGMLFLQSYVRLANDMFALGKPWLFPLYPKLHSFHEIILGVRQSQREHGMAINPILFCCQIDEDVVGRTARLSRRVNIRKVMGRTIDRYLIASYTAFTQAKLLV